MKTKESYNFKIADNHLNTIIKNNYPLLKANLPTNTLPNIPELESNLNHDIKYSLPKPKKITTTPETHSLEFELLGQSNIFGNSDYTTTNTKFTLTELKNITKDRFAYTVLYFPNYENKTLKDDYLLSTLLVAYLLKSRPNNYDLTIQGKTGTKAKIICMVTPDIDTYSTNLLKLFYDEVLIVPYIAPPDCDLPDSIKSNPNIFIPIQDVSKGHINKSHGYYKVFTKFNIFNKKLFPYEKVILLDSDLFTLGYYDTLFSIDVPAGVIEHRRLLMNDLGISSWINDRNHFCKHGKLIPSMLTDVENEFASDINASLLIVAPNNELYDRIIGELKTPLPIWFGDNTYHKGFWLGNNFYTYYLLPEQNYLTKRLSGTWKSVDIGFTTWLIDLNESFGFTFAGFIVKPWRVQSLSHTYTINQNSLFSKINNKISNRPYGYQLLNNFIFSMILEIRNKHSQYFSHFSKKLYDISIILDPFDPWEPEFDIKSTRAKKKLGEFNETNLHLLSYDQRKLYYLCSPQRATLLRTLNQDYYIDNITRNIFNVHFMSLTYNLIDFFYNICSNNNLINNLFPFGNSLTSLYNFGMFDITDDDNDFILLLQKNSYKDVIRKLISTLIGYNLQVYLCLFSNKFIRVVPDGFEGKNEGDIFLKQLYDGFDFGKLKFFNVSYLQEDVEGYLKEAGVTLDKSMLLNVEGNHYLKMPWVDVFFCVEEEDGILLNLYEKVIKFTKPVFFNNYYGVNEEITGKFFRIPDIDLYSKEYYGNDERLKKYVIKPFHNSDDREPIFKIFFTKENVQIINNVFGVLKKNIKELYDRKKIVLKPLK